MGWAGITMEGTDTLSNYFPVLKKNQGTCFPSLGPESLQSTQLRASHASEAGIPLLSTL